MVVLLNEEWRIGARERFLIGVWHPSVLLRLRHGLVIKFVLSPETVFDFVCLGGGDNADVVGNVAGGIVW
jgi:hypothetical protein